MGISALAQDRSVSVNVKDVTVKELLKAIETESSYTFAYVDTDIDLNKKVTVNAKSESIESIIGKVLPDVDVEFKGTKILLSRKSADSSAPKAKNGPRKVRGKVLDNTGAPAIGQWCLNRARRTELQLTWTETMNSASRAP